MTKKLIKSTGFLILFIPVTYLCYAQKLSITDQKAKTEEGFEIDSWTAHLDQEVNEAQKSFSAFIESSFKLKTEKRTKTVLVVEKSAFSEISLLRMDIRAIFQPESGGCAVSFVFAPGYDVYLSNLTYRDEFLKAQVFVYNYVRFHYNMHYNKVINEIKIKIKGKESDIKSAENKIEKLKNTIVENETKIDTGDPNTQKLKEKNARSQHEIEDKKNEIELIKSAILKFQDEINLADACLKMVEDFK